MNITALSSIESFFVIPDDGLDLLLGVISRANNWLDIYIYKLTNAKIIAALEAAVDRGVRVRAIVERAPSDDHDMGQEAFRRLVNIGVAARWAPRHFVKSHAKSLVADGAVAVISTFNFVEDWEKVRDYGIITRDSAIIAGFNATFAADWRAADWTEAPPAPLVLSPQTSRAAVLALISSAQKSIVIEHEQFEDEEIAHYLAERANGGKSVRLITDPDHKDNRHAITQLLHAAPAVEAVESDKLEIHAKMLLIDDSLLLIGSLNLTPESLDKRREISVIVSDPATIRRALQFLAADFANAKA